MEKRRLIAQVLFALNVLGCAFWVYREVGWVFEPETGSGGIAGVSFGILGALVTIVPPIVTIVLARLSGSQLAKWWRNAHLTAALALIIVPMIAGVYTLVISILVFPPVTVFFVIGSIAIWIASPRKQSATAES